MEVLILSKEEIENLKADVHEIKKRVKEMTSPAEAFMDNAQFIKLMNVSSRTAQAWRDEGKIGFSQEGRKIYYRMSDIDAFFQHFHNKPFAIPKYNR